MAVQKAGSSAARMAVQKVGSTAGQMAGQMADYLAGYWERHSEQKSAAQRVVRWVER